MDILTSGFDTPKELIGYCDLHCETPRALFHGTQINDMLKLAGYPEGFPREIGPDDWRSVKGDMKTLCELATARLDAKGEA